jgi:hypothetical protein
MAHTRSARSFPLAAWLFVVGGVLLLLEQLLARVAPSALDTWLVFFAYLALTVAFVALFLWRSVDLLLRVAFLAAAVGFALLALSEVASVGGALVIIGDILVLVGVLVAGILVFVRHVFSRGASIAFLILGIVTALVFLSVLFTFITGTLLVILVVLFGVMLVVTGILIARRR